MMGNTFDISGRMMDVGNVMATVDAVRTARTRNTLLSRQLEQDKRAEADEAALRAARGAAWGGDQAALGQLAVLAPQEAQGLRSYFEGLGDKRRAEELAATREQVEMVGKIAAYVKASPDPAAAWAEVYQNMPEDKREGLPQQFSAGFVDMALAKAMSIDQLLDEMDKSRGKQSFDAGVDALTAQPQTTAPNIELSPGAPVPGPQLGIKGPGEKARYAYSKYVNAGVPAHVAAGLVGNFMAESGAELNPSAWNQGEGALGIGQWRHDRLENLKQFAASRGTQPTDFDTQLEFALHEMQTTEQGAAQKVFGAKNAAEAAALVDQHYERSSGQHRDKRIGYAQSLMDEGGAETSMGGGLDPQLGTLMKLAGDPNLSPTQVALYGQLIESMQGPEELSPSERYSIVGEDLVDLAGEGGPQRVDLGQAPKQDFGGEEKLRKEFTALKPVQEFQAQATAVQRLASAAQDPSAAGDLAMIFSFMKLLDPTSVVRETEFANAQNAAGVPERIRNLWNKARTGERLAPGQRQDFLNLAGAIYKGAEAQYKAISDQYAGIAQAQGLDPIRTIPTFGFTGEMPSGAGSVPPPNAAGQGAPPSAAPQPSAQVPSGQTSGGLRWQVTQ